MLFKMRSIAMTLAIQTLLACFAAVSCALPASFFHVQDDGMRGLLLGSQAYDSQEMGVGSLQKGEVNEHRCVGTLVSYKFMITNAACIHNFRKPKRVIVGKPNLSGRNSADTVVKDIVEATVHPDYNGDDQTSLENFDISIVKIANDGAPKLPAFKLNDHSGNEYEAIGVKGIVVGWSIQGSTMLTQGVYGKQRALELTIKPCVDGSTNSICAGFTEQVEVGTCNGFDGAPFIVDDPNGSGERRVVGILTSAQGCGSTQFEAKFVQVSAMYDFVQTYSYSTVDTKSPTPSPVPESPTEIPTKQPTKNPTKQPSKTPTKQPTKTPTKQPTKTPTKQPTEIPTTKPATGTPTKQPTGQPTKQPTEQSTDFEPIVTLAPTPESTEADDVDEEVTASPTTIESDTPAPTYPDYYYVEEDDFEVSNASGQEPDSSGPAVGGTLGAVFLLGGLAMFLIYRKRQQVASPKAGPSSSSLNRLYRDDGSEDSKKLAAVAQFGNAAPIDVNKFYEEEDRKRDEKERFSGASFPKLRGPQRRASVEAMKYGPQIVQQDGINNIV